MSRGEVNARRSTVTLHVVSSLDSFIAKKDNSVAWMNSPGDIYERGVSEGNADDVVTSIDCFVLGSRTYEHALELGWPYGDTPTVVITNRELPSRRKGVEFYSGDLKKLVDEILAPEGLVKGIRIRESHNGNTREIDLDGVFVAIGHNPNSIVFRGKLDMDENGYLIPREGSLTSVPGVFAAGDVRAGAMNRVASAVGEGSMVVRLTHEYLALT